MKVIFTTEESCSLQNHFLGTFKVMARRHSMDQKDLMKMSVF